MKVWLLTVGEPLPLVDPGNPRLLRTGVLARRLTELGHQVTWWTSTFDHYAKRQRSDDDRAVDWGGVDIRMLHSVGYRRNVSLQRFMEHRGVARKFAAAAPGLPRPDVILASLPTLELARSAVEFGRRCEVPVLVDVRDLWPDVLMEVAPRPLRWLARILLHGQHSLCEYSLRHCAGVVGISDAYLDWGLRIAGRARREADAIFPLGYVAPRPSEGSDERAAATLRDRGVDPTKILCWYVGSFGRQYDLLPIMEAARRVAAAGRRDVQFVISGEGEQGESWRAAAAGADNVLFTGWIDGDAINWLRGHAAIGFQPYVAGAPQGLANKLFEYLSAGIPVVSSLGGENAKLIATHDCGLTYQPGSGEDCAEKVLALLSDPERRATMAANGKRLFMQQFHPDTIFDGLVNHLAAIANKTTLQRNHEGR
jgi:glycosyltransferase involved in cell wall biosynthesis